MKPLLNNIIAGTEMSFKNNSVRIKLTGLSVKNMILIEAVVVTGLSINYDLTTGQ